MNIKIDLRTLQSDSSMRDNHVQSALETSTYPYATFVSVSTQGLPTTYTDGQTVSFKLIGNLTMHGITKPIVLDLEVGGVAKDPWGGTHAAFSATGKLDRRDYGVEWNQTVEGGGLLIGNEVDIELDIEGIPQS